LVEKRRFKEQSGCGDHNRNGQKKQIQVVWTCGHVERKMMEISGKIYDHDGDEW
jgi:hypothetical protein